MTLGEQTRVWYSPRGRRFPDRAAAGRALAAQLCGYIARPNVVVLALPRGGVPVGYEIARALGAPLDLILVRKLGAPGEEELAMGAIAEGGVRVLNEHILAALPSSSALVDRVAAREAAEICRQARAFRGDRPPPDLRGRTVILVDDGLATGATMRAAIAAARAQAPARLIVAVPVAAGETVANLCALVDEIAVVEIPPDLGAIGLWYHNFSQVSDDEVRALLQQVKDLRAAG